MLSAAAVSDAASLCKLLVCVYLAVTSWQIALSYESFLDTSLPERLAEKGSGVI